MHKRIQNKLNGEIYSIDIEYKKNGNEAAASFGMLIADEGNIHISIRISNETTNQLLTHVNGFKAVVEMAADFTVGDVQKLLDDAPNTIKRGFIDALISKIDEAPEILIATLFFKEVKDNEQPAQIKQDASPIDQTVLKITEEAQQQAKEVDDILARYDKEQIRSLLKSVKEATLIRKYGEENYQRIINHIK